MAADDGGKMAELSQLTEYCTKLSVHWCLFV